LCDTLQWSYVACIIFTEDGSDIYASTLGASGAFAKIGAAITDTDVRLARWLTDVSQRPAPFLDLDLRALSSESRTAFWLGVERAVEQIAFWDQSAEFSWTVDVIRQLYERRGAKDELFDVQIPSIDLDDLWFDHR
jgi:hypothetical protein